MLALDKGGAPSDALLAARARLTKPQGATSLAVMHIKGNASTPDQGGSLSETVRPGTMQALAKQLPIDKRLSIVDPELPKKFWGDWWVVGMRKGSEFLHNNEGAPISFAISRGQEVAQECVKLGHVNLWRAEWNRRGGQESEGNFPNMDELQAVEFVYHRVPTGKERFDFLSDENVNSRHWQHLAHVVLRILELEASDLTTSAPAQPESASLPQGHRSITLDVN